MACQAITHKLHTNSPQIRAANPFDFVWHEFCAYIADLVADNVFPSETFVFVAYHGETCDLRWIWKHTQAPRTQLEMPLQMKFFMDPKAIIGHYTGCRLDPSKSGLESLELGYVWKQHITGNNLNGAHDSMVDVCAQMDIVCNQHSQGPRPRQLCQTFSRCRSK